MEGIKDHGYRYIVLWGRLLGSFDYYIQWECNRAKADNAPMTAIYREHESDEWQVAENVTNPRARTALGLEG